LTIKRILSGDPPVIHGDGAQSRDFIYVTDTVDAAIAAYQQEATRGQVINVGSGRDISINDLMSAIARNLYYAKEMIRDMERPGDIRCLVADITLAGRLFGFAPRVELGEGLKLTVQWYRDRGKMLDIGGADHDSIFD